VRLKLDDLFAARAVARELAPRLAPGADALDWTRVNAAFFSAVELEKRVMFIILALIVFVAAINIISTLVVAVADRQSDIAILRTVGASPASVVRIFMVQGIVIGVIGTVAGLAAGVATALNIDVIVPAIENAFRFKIFANDVYLIPDLPSELQSGDVVAVTLMALLLSFLAALYPSWRAAHVNPAEALRYE
jgi:lipoprotein-releasing system permease protein